MTAQMTAGQARVVDPVLTTVAQGYKNQDLVGFNLFPAVPTALRGGKVIQFGKEAFKLYNTSRAPGGAIKRLQVGYQGSPFAIENHALAALVPWEIQDEASTYPGIDLTARSVSTVMKSLLLELEVQQATLAQNASLYDSNHKIALSGTSKWSDPSSDPIAQIDSYKEAIRTSTGVYPNTINFGAAAWVAFKNNPAVKDRIKYTQTALITEQLAAALLGIPNVSVGKAVSAADDGTFGDVWGNNVVLAYTALGSLSAEEPSYGYTYRLNGNPTVDQPWYDPTHKSWIYTVTDERVPVQTGFTAGFLVQTPA
jgi:hypothetical protein